MTMRGPTQPLHDGPIFPEYVSVTPDKCSASRRDSQKVTVTTSSMRISTARLSTPRLVRSPSVRDLGKKNGESTQVWLRQLRASEAGTLLTNCMLGCLFLAALCFDILDMASNRTHNTSRVSTLMTDTYPIWSFPSPLQATAYVPCQQWLMRMKVIESSSFTVNASPLDLNGSSTNWEVTNDMTDYYQLDKVTEIRIMLRDFRNHSIPPEDLAADSYCFAFVNQNGNFDAVANLAPSHWQRLQGLERLDWVDANLQAMKLDSAQLGLTQQSRLIIAARADHSQEKAASSTNNAPTSIPNKQIQLRFYDQEVTMKEFKLGSVQQDEIDAFHGKKLLAEAYLWASRLSSCDASSVATRFQLALSPAQAAAVVETCEQVVAKGDPWLREDLVKPRTQPSQSLYPQLIPYQQMFGSMPLLGYKVPPRQGVTDLIFATTNSPTFFHATQNVAVAEHTVYPVYEQVIETGTKASIKGGELKPSTDPDNPNSLPRTGNVNIVQDSPNASISNATVLVDIQIALYLVLLVLSNGVRYVPRYLTETSLLYMLSRTSFSYVVMLQYAVWNYSNMPSLLHLSAWQLLDIWSNYRAAKNYLVTACLISILLYRMAFRRQIRVDFIIALTLVSTVFLLFSMYVGLSTQDMTMGHYVLKSLPNQYKQTIDGLASKGSANCFHADSCMPVASLVPTYVYFYLPIVVLFVAVFVVDFAVQVYFRLKRRRLSPNGSAASLSNTLQRGSRRKSSLGQLLSFEANCLGQSCRKYFGALGDYYEPFPNDPRRLRVKRRYIVLSGFVYPAGSNYLIRNRDLIALWVARFSSRIAVMTMTYWPIDEFGEVGPGLHADISIVLHLRKLEFLKRHNHLITARDREVRQQRVTPGPGPGPDTGRRVSVI